MAEKRDYYEVLGITDDEKKLSGEEFNNVLKRKYRDAAKKYHPDTHPDDKDAEEKFKEAAEAYEVLKDANKRSQYDQFGFDSTNGFGNFGGMSMDDIIRHFTEDIGDDIFFGTTFNRFFGGNNKKQQVKQRGGDLRIKVKLTLNEIAEGCTKKIKLKRLVPCQDCNGSGSSDGKLEKCPHCNGSGKEIRVEKLGGFGVQQLITTCSHCHGTGTLIKNKCKTCNGSGLVNKEEVIDVNIPKGLIGGMQLTMDGYGNYAPNGGVPGCLYILIEEEKDSRFQRDDWNLLYNLNLTIPQAILGDKVTIPTLNKDVVISIQKGTKSGKMLKLAGYGLPKINQYGNVIGNGDLLISVTVNIPDKLTKEETDLINKLKELPNFKTNKNE